MSDLPMTPLPDKPPLPEGVDPCDITKALAAASHPMIIQELALRAAIDTVSTTSLLAISDHFYKVSGLSAKQEAKPQGSFVFNIHLGGNEITVSGESEPIEMEKPTFLENFRGELGPVPDFMARKPGNLAELVEFSA